MRIEYLPQAVDFEREPVWEVAAREVRARGGAGRAGDLLVFMPGAYEISRTVQAVQDEKALRDFVVLPLHGELPPEAQDRAVARYDTPQDHRLDQRRGNLADHRRRDGGRRQRSGPAWRVTIRTAASTRS